MRSLLLEACKAGAFGEIRRIGEGSIAIAGFLFLSGKANDALTDIVRKEYPGRVCVPLSESWTLAMEALPDYGCATRWAMREGSQVKDAKRLAAIASAIPSGYTLSRMTAGDCSDHPFGQGLPYGTPEAFEREGVGCVVRHEGRIVCAASSFLTFERTIEVDVSTSPEHRRRGLALACGAGLLLLCLEKGLHTHWDAQNEPSRHLAERLGYEDAEPYTVYARREFLDRMTMTG